MGWRCPACHPQSKTGSPTQTSLLVTPPASPPPPPPGFPPLPPGFYQSRLPRSPPRYPCSICSLEVGKDSLKCSTCSKWVHFSCSSLTQADFRKICAAGSPMDWNCPPCLNGDLASPTNQQASLQLHIHPHPLHFLAQISWIHLYLSPHILPSLTPTLLPPSPYLSHHHHPLAHNQSTTRRPTLKEIHASPTFSEFCNGMQPTSKRLSSSISTHTPSTSLLRSHGFISTSPLTSSPP